jgi:hypothetical protein
MRRCFFTVAFASLLLFGACQKEGVPHTGDETGNLYAVWALDSKTEISKKSNGEEISNKYDYSDFHFYLVFGEVPFPHAIAKKGSFTSLDLDDVDVDGVRFTYNAEKRQINFNQALWLSEGLLYHMRLSGTYDVLDLTDTNLTLQQEVLGIKTIFSYHKFK